MAAIILSTLGQIGAISLKIACQIFFQKLSSSHFLTNKYPQNVVSSFFNNKKKPSTILSQTAAGQAEPKKVRIFSTKSCFLIVEAAWREMLQLHFEGAWTVNGKNTERQISSNVTGRATAGQALGPKERGFKTKCTCDQVERLPQPASPLLFIEKDKQAPALSVLLQ